MAEGQNNERKAITIILCHHINPLKETYASANGSYNLVLSDFQIVEAAVAK